jgi:pyrroline-5-carboxylate reductase
MLQTPASTIAFIGGGNMATALIGGLVRAGRAPASILVIDPGDDQRAKLQAAFGVQVQPVADAALGAAGLVVWAVKPQLFTQAAAPCAPHLGHALHLSVMAGIRSDAIARAVCALNGQAPAQARIVRSMPNTPALIGRGIAGLFATPAVTAAERDAVEQVLAPTGQTLWVDSEADLDAVTALSGSGPAYVFYWLEAMVAAAEQMGLSAEQGQRLALATFDGATALAAQSSESPAVLRERVTSKGGTTFAALEAMRGDGVADAIARAVLAARQRAIELGDAFGG